MPPVTLKIYFTSTRPSGDQTPPFNASVTRLVPGGVNPITASLDEYFAGPTAAEEAQGLVVVRNGFVSYRRVDLTNGILSVYLAGYCETNGTSYSIDQPLIATLKQFLGVYYVKIYDGYDHTRDPIGRDDSWPVCLDVVFTPTFTATPTASITPSPEPSDTPSPEPTRTPIPTATDTPVPTDTPIPSLTPTPLPTDTPTATQIPTSTPYPTNTRTRTPVPTDTPVPSRTPSRTPTPPPTWTLTSTPSLTPLPTLTFTPSVTPRPTDTPTLIPSHTPVPSPTITPTRTPTRTPLPTLTPSLTLTPAPTLTPTFDPRCNRASFVGDVTIVDDSIFHFGEPLTKTWRIRNTGTCAWTSAYRLVWAGGDKFAGPDSVPIPTDVAPNQTVDVSVTLTAPGAPGEYQSFWQLRSPDGRIFGVGGSADLRVWVKIRVIPPVVSTATSLSTSSPIPPTIGPMTATPAVPEIALDFVVSACQAQWQSNDGILPCPGQDADPRGFVLIQNQALLEDGSSNLQPTLLTLPSASADGYILGLYPPYQVQVGDHFIATVGCELNASSCSVLFRLSYLDSAGAARDLWSIGEFYDGKVSSVDVDLSRLAGQQVRLVLSVGSLGTSTGDRALWVEPRIVRTPVTAPVFTATSAPSLPPPSPTATPAPTLSPATPTPTPAPTATPAPASLRAPSASPLQQIVDSIIAFFRNLFGGR